MDELYASVIVDISAEKLDRPFTYRVGEALREELKEGMEVLIPFGKGNTLRKGYVVELKDVCAIEKDKLKEIADINRKAVGLEARTMALAAWMKKTCGGTLINAMRTVLPVKKKIQAKSYKTIILKADRNELAVMAEKLSPLRFAARLRLYRALAEADELPEEMVRDKLKISASVLKTAEKDGIIEVRSSEQYRTPSIGRGNLKAVAALSPAQEAVAKEIMAGAAAGDRRPSLIYGITGSGKTEVYMEIIAEAVSRGKQCIVLIPEIALSFQTLMRFYARFGDRVSVMHSRLSEGERYDQFQRAAKGKLDIMIGPRSALFTPFPDPGVIIIDEEHEGSYKSERAPKYHAREAAEYLASVTGATLVLGSATPSMESWYRAQQGEYRLFKLGERYGGARLPRVSIADMREELKAGNRSFFSDKLKSLITDRLFKGEQSMLFINRRGVAGFVSCRSCGYVVRCPHCDVSLTQHRDGRLYCHYCGHSEDTPKLCPECGSKYIAGFKAGTERIEDELKKLYPQARVSRMDADTTKNRDDYERILQAFADGDADILVGTQMIVKGHDFPNVTLVGAIAADISLYAGDYHASERTYQLLAQAAGRAGRAGKPGEVVIQTYQPEHYSIVCAASQDYESFYERELSYRRLAAYPPFSHMLSLQFFSRDPDAGMERARLIKEKLKGVAGDLVILGPSEALIGKLKDVYRCGMYLRHGSLDVLIAAKDAAEAAQAAAEAAANSVRKEIHYGYQKR